MSTMAPPVVARVIQTPELLELILLRLPTQDLLVTAQRINRTWKGIITSSPVLQRALLFRPVPQPSAPPERPSFNPLLQKVFPLWFKADPGIKRGQNAVTTLPWASDYSARAAVMRATASWRRMLLCQPAKTLLEVAGKNNNSRGIFETNGIAHFPDGVRMGTLSDLGYQSMRTYVSGFWILWDEPGAEPEKMVMFTHHSWFKSLQNTPDVGLEFRSKAYSEVTIDVTEEGRSRQWHQGFGNPPIGGWKLRRPISAPADNDG